MEPRKRFCRARSLIRLETGRSRIGKNPGFGRAQRGGSRGNAVRRTGRTLGSCRCEPGHFRCGRAIPLLPHETRISCLHQRTGCFCGVDPRVCSRPWDRPDHSHHGLDTRADFRATGKVCRNLSRRHAVPPAVEFASDKYRTIQLAESIGIAVPSTLLVKSPAICLSARKGHSPSW